MIFGHNPSKQPSLHGSEQQISDWYILEKLQHRAAGDGCWCGDSCTCGG